MPHKAPTHRPHRTTAPKFNARGEGPTERQRRRAMHTGSKGWRMQRERVLLRDRYTCQHCGCYGDQVDHIHGDAEQVVTDDRLQVLCLGCHSQKTAREQNEQRRTGRARRGA